MNGLTSLEAALVIRDNALLPSLEGLGNLTSVGTLAVDLNEHLTNLDGLGHLTTVEGGPPGDEDPDLYIAGNAMLASIDSLNGMTTFTGEWLLVSDNTVLPTCAAEALDTMLRGLGWDGTTTISGNDDTGTCE